MVAESVEDAVGGDEGRGLADEGCAAGFEGVEELREGELGVEAGDGFELVECATGVAQAAAGDHGDADARDTCWRGCGEASGGKDGCDEEGGLIADAASGVLVDGEGVQGSGVEGFAGEAHGGGEGGEFLRRETAQVDGHEEGGGLSVGDGAIDDAVDKVLDLRGGEWETVTLVTDDVDDVEWLCGLSHGVYFWSCGRTKPAGRSSAMVA